MCRNPKLWIAVGVAAVAVAIAAPNLGGVLPILLVAACPLMMLVMMGGMAGMARGNRSDDPTSAASASEEVARLRAEVDELRAHR
jgi:hypothetical protein